MRLVVVGESPNRAAEVLVSIRVDWKGWPDGKRIAVMRKLAGTGTCGQRLSELAGVEFHEWLALTDRYNVLDRWPGRDGKGDAFPKRDAALGILRLAPLIHSRRVVLLGKRAAGAFKFSDEYLRWDRRRIVIGFRQVHFEGAIFPHPSGINRWWNVPGNEKRAARFLRKAFLTARSEGT